MFLKCSSSVYPDEKSLATHMRQGGTPDRPRLLCKPVDPE